MKLGVSADGSDDYRNVANTYGWVPQAVCREACKLDLPICLSASGSAWVSAMGIVTSPYAIAARPPLRETRR
jgi:hypothetical protein